ncbi:nicotinate-nucleotide--dimethylbenzimidazole phosphoribosyltransferase [uncultured Desulfuromusa sp.]|uniref:nicotinate-nucleotide--dimethylbenzimidazole phosphoribosyltransferase n=1 Tax=uncultured Desulfuromusa sp. TaxID=219183 RepID=UPI002AA6E93C|nr:nicotinate-nucleotide--dimethylbenzimidazole phosphoribosyltransferase [uncultured Desulfuromusa sp.]
MQLLNKTITSITGQNETSRTQAEKRLSQLIMPHWALGRLMDLAVDIAGICASIRPAMTRKKIVVMAGDHGIVDAGISLYPKEVTVEMVRGIVNGVAGINVLARQAGADVTVVDMGVAGDLSTLSTDGNILDRKIAAGTNNFAEEAAMSRDQAVRALEAGISVAQELGDATDLFGTGDMGIGNTSPSSAIIAALCQLPIAATVGRGTGLDDAQLEHKISVLEKALELHKPDPNDPIDVLSKVGGFEIAGIAGLILGAASLKKPIIIDGVISTAAALVAARLAPKSKEYMIAAHRSVEKGQVAALADLGKEPLLDLQFRLGEGTGAAVAMNLVEGAVAILTEMATFSEAAVSEAK